MSKLPQFALLAFCICYCEALAAPSVSVHKGVRTPTGVIVRKNTVIVGGVVYSLMPNSDRRVIINRQDLSVEQDELRLIVRNRHIRVNGKDYGSIRAGDCVSFTADGHVLINGNQRKSAPQKFRPKQNNSMSSTR